MDFMDYMLGLLGLGLAVGIVVQRTPQPWLRAAGRFLAKTFSFLGCLAAVVAVLGAFGVIYMVFDWLGVAIVFFPFVGYIAYRQQPLPASGPRVRVTRKRDPGSMQWQTVVEVDDE